MLFSCAIFLTTTAGLNVPAPSHRVPRGAITGWSDNRCHTAKGRGRASCADEAVGNPTSIRTVAEFETTLCTSQPKPRPMPNGASCSH
jgi:hypothetical protein